MTLDSERAQPTEFSGQGLSGSNLEHTRDHNQRVTLQAIRLNGPLTRLDLARITGLTLPSIANITKRLLAAELIIEETRREGRRGQPAIYIAVNPAGCYALGINIDRDHVSFAIIDFMGDVRARVDEEVAYASPDEVTKLIRKHLPRLLKAGKIERQKLIGVGVAVPDELGRLELPSQRPDSYRQWQDVDIRELVSEATSLPVFVENDAAAAALGELQFGGGAQAGSFFYLFLGIGLGGGLILDGKCFRGADGRSGEIGFLPVSRSSGKEISLADIVSLSALYARLAKRNIRIAQPAQLLTLNKTGSLVVEAWLDEATSHLLDLLASITCLINPETIFVGGRLPRIFLERLSERLNEALRLHLAKAPSMPEVRVATRAEDAAVLGAAVLPIGALLLPNDAALLKSADARS